MGRRRPLRGRAVHRAAFPFKAGTLLFTHEDKAAANPTAPQIPPITEAGKRNTAMKHLTLGRNTHTQRNKKHLCTIKTAAMTSSLRRGEENKNAALYFQ